MGPRRHVTLPVALILAAVVLAVWLARRPADGPHPSATDPEHSSLPVPPAPTLPDVPHVEPSLTERKSSLLAMGPDQAREWLLRELDDGRDYPTRDDLGIGPDGTLKAWPSYRVFLLDMLHLLDPALAAHRSRELIGHSQSPDEWAVALRNVARADAGGTDTPWVRAKAAELLRNETWRADPSAGYLEAFDVIVHTRHTELSPELLTLCDHPDQKAVRHAAFMTLDRLLIENPGDVLPVLAQAAGKVSHSELMISNLMARADVREEPQRAALEAYLLDPTRTRAELASFANVFPNANAHVSSNLLTTSPTFDGADLADRDVASLALVELWLADSRFEGIQPALHAARRRLTQFVGR